MCTWQQPYAWKGAADGLKISEVTALEAIVCIGRVEWWRLTVTRRPFQSFGTPVAVSSPITLRDRPSEAKVRGQQGGRKQFPPLKHLHGQRCVIQALPASTNTHKQERSRSLIGCSAVTFEELRDESY